MAEIFIKNNNGEMKKVGDADDNQFSRIQNDTNIGDIKKELDAYWTDEKLGKHMDLKAKHGTILLKNLKVPASDFFEQIKKNHFTFQNFGPISLNTFLKKAKIDLYVQPSYIDDCLAVTTPRPAIGRGEFLFVSTFNNIRFAGGKGDLIDANDDRIEVKGKHANFGSDGPYKQMNQSLLYSIYSLFGTNTSEKNLTLDAMNELQTLMIKNPQKQAKVLTLLQNLKQPSTGLTNQMVELFNNTHDLPLTIAATHFLTYMKVQKANYLLALNDKVFWCFKSPTDLSQAATIMKNFNINGWISGNKGISFTVKNG